MKTLGLRVLFAVALAALVGPAGARCEEPPTGVRADQEKAKLERSDVVATVNGEALYAEDVAAVLGEIHEGATPEERTDFDMDQMLFRLVNDTLLAQEARTLGMDRDESIRKSVARLRERLAVRRLEKEEIYDRMGFDDEALERLYGTLFSTATLRVVTRKDEAEAKQLRARIEEGASLEELAREQSQDPYSMRGGLMNEVPRIDLAASFAEAVFAMEPGQLGGPVPTNHGWTVFRVERFAEAKPELYERRKGEVLDVLRYQQREALRSELLVRLRESHEVELHDDVYQSIGVEVMFDGRLLPKIDDPAAAVVEAGGRRITAARFGQALAARWGSIASPEVALGIKPVLLDSLTIDELIAAEALRRGYDSGASVDREAHALETRLLVRQYLEEVVAPQAEPSSEELESYFEEHSDEFRRPPRLYLSQLTVATREEAERLAELARSGTEFSWLARRHSLDTFKDSSGSVGWVAANEGLRGFERELLTARSGDVFGPKGSEGSWQLVHVGAVEEQGLYPFQEVSGNVRSRLEGEKFLKLIDTYITRLRERSEITINREAVDALRIQAEEGENDAEPQAPGHGGR